VHGVKSRVADLAAFGGEPAFAEPLHTGRPNLGDMSRFLERLQDLLERRWLTNNGPLVLEFERRVAELAGVRHCVAMCNATVGLQVAARALGMTGEVIVPSFTYPATAHVLAWLGITPVLCDVDRVTGNIDVAMAEAAITPRTTGILGVHVWGRPCEVDRLEDLAARRGLALLFDSAHAFGVVRNGRPLGGSGNAEVFSFHATKFVNSLEGGALVTDDDEVADRTRSLRNFGFVDDDVQAVGTNAKMNEVCAAMGLTSLDSMEEFLAVNLRNHLAYRAGLAGVDGVRLHEYEPDIRSNHQFVVIEVDERRIGLGRADVMRVLRAENVITRAHFSPGCHRMRPYRDGIPQTAFPNTDALAARVITLPTGNAIGEHEIGRLCALIRFIVAHGASIAERLGEPVPVP
jgi:dTDP-4-amino-4,6-dideoxygalactose transaminase